MGEYSAKGFIGVLKTMSTNKVNGISLFRRGRVIVGSHDEKYRPKDCVVKWVLPDIKESLES